MRLFLLGATGRVGREVLAQGRRRGHGFTAFVRSPEKLRQLGEAGELGQGLTAIRGDPRVAAELAVALPGHDAVISALGPPGLGKSTLLRDSAAALVKATLANGPARALWVSAAMLFPDAGVLAAVLRTTLLRRAAEDALAMESEIETSALDWTIVRPPRLTLGPLTGHYRVADGRFPDGRGALARADVAHFLLDEVEQGAHRRQVVGLAG